MEIINRFEKRHKDYFVFEKPEHIHPHDHFLAWSFLRLIPRSFTPNQMTAVRILLIPFIVSFLLTQKYILGIVLFLIAAFTDALDGSMARTRNQITKFGKLFDPLADKLLVGIMIVLVVFENFHWLLGVALIGIEVVFIMSAVFKEVQFKTVEGANVWGKIKMILQVFALFLTLVALVWKIPFLFTFAAWCFGLAIGFAVVSLFAHGI